MHILKSMTIYDRTMAKIKKNVFKNVVFKKELQIM